MFFHFLVFLVLFTNPLLAQRKVSEVCAKQKAAYDSAMVIEYGEEMFTKYFRFDHTSYVWADANHLCEWNKPMFGDTVYKYEFDYLFDFPGALASRFYVYCPDHDDRGRLVRDTVSAAHGKLITQAHMSRITWTYLHKPLWRCCVSIYSLSSYSSGGKFPTRKLDSTHVYLEVEYELNLGGWRRGSICRSWTKSIVVDGFTGEVLGPVEKDYDTYTIGGRF